MRGLLTRRRRTVVVGAAVAALVTAANASQGAYFSQSWGWVALAFLMPTTISLILGVAETPGRLRIAFAALIVAFGVWIALSALWSLSSGASIREAERVLVYVSLAVALALVVRRGDASGVLGGLLVGIVSVASYAFATRLFPDVLRTYDQPDLPYRLSEPIGYWNALGLFAVLGIALALGAAAHARRLVNGAAAAAFLPMLTCTLYFTFSRGAWAALVVAIVAMVVADARRLRLLWTTLAVAPPCALAVALAARQSALTTEAAPRAQAVSEGRWLAIWLAVLIVLAGTLAILARVVARRRPAGRDTRRAFNVTLGATTAAVVVFGVIWIGGPTSAVSELRDRFESELAVKDPRNLNERLFSFSANGRVEHIRVAWDVAREHPIVGNGAGTYEYAWYLLRPLRLDVRDAHSLYAEVLAEVGAVGLVLLLLALVLPAIGAVFARRSRAVPAAFGAYVAWVVHSAMDWHWEVVGVSSTALLAGGACMLGAERRRGAPLRPIVRLPVLVGAALLSVAAVISLVGNQALFASRDAVRAREWGAAREHARRAEALLPWSHEPLIARGDSEAGLGSRTGALAAYRGAVAKDTENWVAWLRFAQLAHGAERKAAYARVRALNPLEKDLPGEQPTTGS